MEVMGRRSFDARVYKVESPTGSGVMTSYGVFPGIELIYNDFHDYACFEPDNNRSDLIEINYCLKGRFECEFKSNKVAYVGEGDFAVNLFSNEIRQASFPLGFYQGITVMIDMPEAAGHINTLMEDVSIDLYALRQNLCTYGECFCIRANETIKHVFAELYQAEPEIRRGYYKLKLLELLLLLGNNRIIPAGEPKKYYERKLVETVKRARSYLVENIREHITIEGLVAEFGVGRTLFLNCFKEVYGLPVYAYMKEYRMNAAAVMLTDSEKSVAYIADFLGYQSTSKFAAAFRSTFGMLPSEYRKRKMAAFY